MNTNSHAPLELIVSLIQKAEANPKLYPEIKKLIYHLLDGPEVRWTKEGTHAVGDIFLDLFGPVSGVSSTITPVQLNRIRHEMADRVRWAESVGDAEMKEIFERAFQRLGN